MDAGSSFYRPSRYVWSMVVTAALTASVTALVVVVLSRGAAVAFLTGGARNAPQSGWAITLLVAPLALGALSALFLIVAIEILRVATYLRALRQYCDRDLQRMGIPTPRALAPLESDGGDALHPSTQPGEREARGDALSRLSASQQTLLLGPAGSGKSVTLLTLARRASSHASIWGALFGLERIPILISLPGLARTVGAGSTAEAYLTAQVAHFGTAGFAARTSSLLRKGRLSLLCDDYDMLAAHERDIVDSAIQAWGAKPFERCQTIIACDSAVFNGLAIGAGRLSWLPTERLGPLRERDVTTMLTNSALANSGRSAAQEYARLGLARPLGAVLTTPAVARALADVRDAGQPPPWGLAGLLRQDLLIKRDRSSEDLDVTDEQDFALVWGALAAALQGAGAGYIPLDSTSLMGECAARWLKSHTPLLPTSFALQRDLAFDPGALERGMRGGVRSGVLRRMADGQGLEFSHPLLQREAASYWLEAMDNGLGRLSSELLTPVWITPVVLWAGAGQDSLDIAMRIYRLSQSPDSVATRAGLSRGADVAPAALALALAAAVEGAAAQLTLLSETAATGSRYYFATQQALRDLLDATAIMAADEGRRSAQMAALRQVNSQIGQSFRASITALINLEPLDRLLRAQLALLLGLIGTPEAIEELVGILGQSEVTIRQAGRQALVFAGVGALPVLQRLVSDPNPALRKRANEALQIITAQTPGVSSVAGASAIAGLRSADAFQRRSAVTTLGAMRSSEAVDALVARLDDTSLEVQVAAATALGSLGAPAGLAALRKRIGSPNPVLRRAIAESLGMTPSAESVALLLTLLADPDSAVRAAAASSLGAHGDKRAVGPLREALRDNDAWVRQAAQAAVRRLTIT